jgi:hypothetical protein
MLMGLDPSWPTGHSRATPRGLGDARCLTPHAHASSCRVEEAGALSLLSLGLSLSVSRFTRMAERPSLQLPLFCRYQYLASSHHLPAMPLVAAVAETAYSEPPCGHRTEPPPTTMARAEPAVVGQARAPLRCGQPPTCPHTSSPPPTATL